MIAIIKVRMFIWLLLSCSNIPLAVTKCARLLWIWLLTWSRLPASAFLRPKCVTDRFHVQKLAYEAVQEMRVKARWEALDEESTQIAYAKACGKMYHVPAFC